MPAQPAEIAHEAWLVSRIGAGRGNESMPGDHASGERIGMKAQVFADKRTDEEVAMVVALTLTILERLPRVLAGSLKFLILRTIVHAVAVDRRRLAVVSVVVGRPNRFELRCCIFVCRQSS